MKKNTLAVLIAVFIAIISFAGFACISHNRNYVTDMDKLHNVMDSIHTKLGNAWAYVDVLNLVVQMNYDDFTKEGFYELSDMAMAQSDCIDSFELAPGAVVMYVNPVEGNEDMLGENLMADAAGKKLVNQSIASGTLSLYGPVEDEQGGTKLYGRRAIMVDGQFWGLAIVTIDFDRLALEAGLVENGDDNIYAVAVTGADGDTSYVWGDAALAVKSKTAVEMVIEGQTWRLVTGHSTNLSGLVREYWLSFVISVLIGIVGYFLASSYMQRNHEAKNDRLTQTLVRAEFQRQVARRLRFGRTPYALLLIDMDGFKEINDTYGHIAGDEVLIRTAERMKRVLRKNDLVSRIGGDEFMVLLSDVDGKMELEGAIGRLRKMTEQDVIVGEAKIHVALSIGHALSTQEGRDYRALYEAADSDMYKNKTERKNQG